MLRLNLDWINRDSPYLRQMREGFGQLRFEPELEAGFARYHAEMFLVRLRWVLLSALVLFVSYGLVDSFSLPESVRWKIVAVRVFVIGPMLALAWLATYRKHLQPHVQQIGAVCALICGLGMNLILWIAHSHGVDMPYEGLILVTMFFYCVAGLRFTAAVSSGVVTFIAYLLVEAATGKDSDGFLQHLFYLGAANVLGAFGCYFIEYSSRQHFIVRNLMQELAEKDSLTGLHNRRAFNGRAEASWRQAVRERRPVALAMMDVDYFKRYNDHYGHGEGDEALRAVARAVGQQARRPLDATGRYGGEEFVGLWYGVAQDEALMLLERLRSEVENIAIPHARSEVAQVVTISVGMIWLVPQKHQSLDEVLRKADEALYQAKAQGRNRVCCHVLERSSAGG